MSLGRRRHRLILSSPFFSISSSDLYFVVVTPVDSGRARPVARVSTVPKITWRAQQLTVVGEMECWLVYLCVCAPNVSRSLSESSTAVAAAAAATSRICLFLIDWELLGRPRENFCSVTRFLYPLPLIFIKNGGCCCSSSSSFRFFFHSFLSSSRVLH